MSNTMLSNSSSGFGVMWRKGPNGKPITVEVNRDVYVDPKVGTYEFELSGISEKFSMPRNPQYAKPNDPPDQELIRIELTIRNHPKREGQMFSELVTPKLGEMATMGRITRAIMGDDLKAGAEFDGRNLLGGRFQGMVIVNKTGTRNKLSGESVRPLGADDEDDDEPIPVAAPAAAKIGGNPYLDLDDE